MRHSFRLALVALFALSLPLAAASVHFKPGSPSFTDAGVVLATSGSIAGLGNGDVTILVSATGSPTAVCVNPSGRNEPAGQNPADVTLTGSVTIPSSQIKNGTLSFNLLTSAPADPSPQSVGCPGANWDAQITDVDFSSATVTIVQGGAVVLQQSYGL